MTVETEHIRGSEALIRALIDSGVTTMFGYPGGSIMPVYDSLYDYTGASHTFLPATSREPYMPPPAMPAQPDGRAWS